MRPDSTTLCFDHDALGIAVSIAEDFGQGMVAADERVVVRNVAVVVQADDAAGMTVQALRLLAVVKAVADCQQQRAVGEKKPVFPHSEPGCLGSVGP